MRIPINMGVKGKVTATLTNTETGEKQKVKGDNLILNHYLDWAMTQGLGILGTTTFNRCILAPQMFLLNLQIQLSLGLN